MVLTVIDEFGELLANGLDIMETWKSHIAVQVGGGGTWVNREDLNGCASLLELDGHWKSH